VYKLMLWFYEKKSFLDGNEIRLTVSSLNVEFIIEEKVKSKISPSSVIDFLYVFL